MRACVCHFFVAHFFQSKPKTGDFVRLLQIYLHISEKSSNFAAEGLNLSYAN